MTSETDNAHLLEAVRYFSGEMSSAEREGFELLLSAGGPVCDALADVVVLQQAVMALQQEAALPTRAIPQVEHFFGRPRRLIWRWMASAGVAAVLIPVFIGGLQLVQSTPRQSDPLTSDPLASQIGRPTQDQLVSVAETWSRLSSTAERSELSEGEVDEPEWSAAPVDVPEWMFAAVDASQMSEDEVMPEPQDGSAL